MQKKKAPLPLRLSVYFVFLLILLVFVAFGYWNNLQSAVSSDTTIQSFTIKDGESMDSVASRLEDQGLIRSSFVFKYLLKESGTETKVGAGEFNLSPSMNAEQIIASLNKGSADKSETLLEGWRDEEMALKLSKDVGIKQADFLKYAKEGYMFPDTYLISPDMTAQDIANLLMDNFKKKYTADLQAKVKAQGLTADQGVILASIVEREGRSDGVRTNIAGILLKRLKIGMPLNVDATVQYAKDSAIIKTGNLPDKFWQPITVADYSDVNSSYNTYLYPGLPPGPICNPSLSSLEAVANADSSTLNLYYYVDSQGNIYYAQTLDQQNQNVVDHP